MAALWRNPLDVAWTMFALQPAQVCQATDSPARDVHLVLDNYATHKHGT